MSIFSRHYTGDDLPASWKSVRFSEGLSCVFLFFGRKVDQTFSLSLPSLSPCPLSLCPSVRGRVVALGLGGWPRPLPARKPVSLSVSKSSEFASIKGELGLEAVEGQGEQPTDGGRGHPCSGGVLQQRQPPAQAGLGSLALCTECMCGLTFGWSPSLLLLQGCRLWLCLFAEWLLFTRVEVCLI